MSQNENECKASLFLHQPPALLPSQAVPFPVYPSAQEH